MRTWWQNLNIRERIILYVAGLVVLFILLDSFVIQQYSLKNQQLVEQIEQSKDDLEWMKQAVFRLPASNKKTSKIMSGRVVTFLDQQLGKQGLKKNMQQMTPIQKHSARLRLSEVEFNKLLKFLAAIQGSVNIDEVRLLPSDKNGFVNVSLVVSNGSKA